MLKNLLFPLLFTFSTFSFSQIQSPEILTILTKIDSIATIKTNLMADLEVLQLKWIQDEINAVGLPKLDREEEIITHSAFSLSYNELHEQANWVMHIILPDIETGNYSRTDDFREDPLVKSGTAQENDYFLKEMKADSTFNYDGYGYDRGHLAPSADFRWSAKAISESYYYSNMSPQIGDFNRKKWAELENWMREYVMNNGTNLIIVTAPVLKENLKKIERSSNSVSIPEQFVKVALDTKNQRGIAFIMPHEEIKKPLEAFAVSIDSAETILGYDLFSSIDSASSAKIESTFDYQKWLPSAEKGDVKAIAFNRLPKEACNTYGAEAYINDGKKHTVCGKVVSTKKHNKGHVFINLDKKFPNQIFSVSIFAGTIQNFTYEPEIFLKDKEVCFTSKIGQYQGTSSMVISTEKQVRLLSGNDVN